MIIGTISALEVTLRISTSNHGFANLGASGQTSWTYFAPTFLFFLGLFITSRRTNPSAIPSPPALVFHALRYRSPIGLARAAIMLIVPFLQITVTDLITPAPQPIQDMVQIAQTTAFNIHHNVRVPDG
ncbi:hypothetical protein C8R43DRAFT_1135737 [Mycena crocata]|nr:hypothetical protein C8R43DRAFT_1135737 [Mycena crocata]